MAEFAKALQSQNIWHQAQQYRDAEIKLVQHRLGLSSGDAPVSAKPAAAPPKKSAPKKESKASQMINELKQELNSDSGAAISDMGSMLNRVAKLEKENNEIKSALEAALKRLDQLEGKSAPAAAAAEESDGEFDPFDMVTVEDSITKRQIDPAQVQKEQDAKKAAAAEDDAASDGSFDPFDMVTVEDSITKRQIDPAQVQKEQDAKKAAKNEDSDADDDEDDDDMDFFGSDDEEEDAAAEALKAKRVAEYNARKAAKEETKGKVAAKSMITLDVKPWDDETDLDELAVKVKTIQMDGLVWGQQIQKKPLAFGIFKLVVTAVVEDEKVSTDDLVENIEAFEDHVQSVDIAAFNKL